MTSPKTFLVCHGAWSAGWAWKKMHPLMQAAGHRLVTPSYTGLGERVHLANPSIDLEVAPRGIAFGPLGKLPERVGGRDACGVDIAARQRQLAALQFQPGACAVSGDVGRGGTRQTPVCLNSCRR